MACAATWTSTTVYTFALTATLTSPATSAVTGDIVINYWVTTGATADTSTTY